MIVPGYMNANDNCVDKRKEYGNGHNAWANHLTLSWDIMLKYSRAMRDAYANKNADVLYDLAEHEPNLELNKLLKVRDICPDVKKSFDEVGIDPREICGDDNPWNYFHFFILGFLTVVHLREGKPPPNSEETDALVQTQNTVRHIFYANFNAWLNGPQIFEVSEPLANKLLLTDVSRLSWDDIRLPFPSFVLQVPPSIGSLKDPGTGEHPLDTIIVTEMLFEGERGLNFLFLGRENENSVQLGDDAAAYASLLLETQDKTIGAALKRRFFGRTEAPTKKYNFLGMIGGLEGDDALEHLILFSLAVIVYISSHPEDRIKYADPVINKLHNRLKKAQGKRRERLLKELKGKTVKPRPYVLGSKITISSELKKLAYAVGKGNHKALNSPHYVRGHFQGYRCNDEEGGKIVKRKWKEPYWRNLDDKKEVPKKRVYAVK